MGSAQSLLTVQNLIAVSILFAVVATVWRNQVNTHVSSGPPNKTTTKRGKKKPNGDGTHHVSGAMPDKGLPAPPISSSEHSIPGGIPEPVAPALVSNLPKPLKEKKRKGKKAMPSIASGPASESATPIAGPSRPSTDSGSPPPAERVRPQPSNTESWTRVEPRKKSSQNPTTSDAGVTTATSVEEDGSSSGTVEEPKNEEKTRSQKTLAEKVLPKGRKTAVDDMLETSHYPDLSRVMRVAPPTDEKPATGFSWGDYEDVEDGRGGDADGEDDGGWGVVKSRGKAKHNQSSSSGGAPAPHPKAPETLTKKQRQNVAKREAAKGAKAEAEAERLALVAKHKRELERSRIAEQYSRKGTNVPGRTVGGGMTAAVSSDGKLVWE
ncbi:hypothetical protein K439DRAFT_963309 [Ramaria rubella]|nr:hypothetical protein K439DRAFT_963309 [Ramaria rubella]